MSTTTNLKLFKHDNPTTNTNQFDVEKALNENWDKVDKNAGEVASKIQTLENTTNAKDTSQDAEIEVLKAENALLKSQIPSATVVGETIHLEDSSNMQCQIVPLGASKQEGKPSIDNEAPIESVGDNINLLDISKGTSANSGLVYYQDDKIVIKASTYVSYTITETIKESDDYALSFYHKVEINSLSYKILINETPLAEKNVSTSDKFSISRSLNKGDVITIQLRSPDGGSGTFEQIILCKGTSTGTYSPYGQGCIEINNVNKNFLKKGIEFKPTEAGWYDCLGNIITTKAQVLANKNYYDLKANTTYTLKLNSYLNINAIQLVYIDASGSLVSLLSKSSNITNAYQITPSEDVRIWFRCQIVSQNTNTYFNAQLELGETATEYVEHQSQTKALYTQQPFRAIGDVKDRFVKVDGVWYEEHNVNKYELTGGEVWTKHTTTNNNAYYFMITNYMNDIPASTINNDGISMILCSHFKTEVVNTFVFNDMQGAGLGTVTSAGQANFFIGTGLNGISTIEELKAWVTEQYTKGKPLTIYYALKTPILIPCTAEQVEVLESFNTYKNVTNISSDSIGELEVIYSKDIETLLNNISQAVLGGN